MTSPVDNGRAAPEVRVGDQERDQATEELREQYALGRLDEQEFHQRLEGAFAARTASELRALVADLPTGSRSVDWRPGPASVDDTADRRRPRRPPWARGRYGHPRTSWHGHVHGPQRAGAIRHPHHHGPGFLPLLPIVGLVLFFGGAGLMFLLPLVLGGLLFSGLRRAAWSR